MHSPDVDKTSEVELANQGSLLFLLLPVSDFLFKVFKHLFDKQTLSVLLFFLVL